MHAPNTDHMKIVKQIIRFLKGTLEYGLHLRLAPLRLIAHCDNDWTGHSTDHRLTSGYCVYLVKAQFVGVPKSNLLLLTPPQNLSIALWPL